MRAVLRELCSAAALGFFLLGFTALSAIVTEPRDDPAVTLAEAAR